MPRQEIVIQFTLSDIAALCGCSKSAIHHHIRKGHLDIEDLVSVTSFLASMATDDIRSQIGMSFGRIGICGAPVPPGSKKQQVQSKLKEDSRKTKKPKRKITRVQG